MDTDVLFPAPTPTPVLTRTPTTVDLHSRIITVPNTRQKSCDACVNGKRGCDRKFPVCSRCESRKVPCIYRRRKPARMSPSSATPSPTSEPEAELARAAASVSNLAPSPTSISISNSISSSIPTSIPISIPTSNSASTSTSTSQHDTEADAPIFTSVIDINLDVDGDTPFTGQELSLIPTAAAQTHSSPPMSSFPLSAPTHASSSSSSSSSCPNASPESLSASSSSSSSSSSPPQQETTADHLSPVPPQLDFDNAMLDYSILDMIPGFNCPLPDSDYWVSQCTDFPDLPALEQQRLAEAEADHRVIHCPSNEIIKPWELKDPTTKIGFMVRQVQQIPVQFAQTRTTPFISPRLYRSRQPRAITHAWTACTVYNARTPATEPWASRVVVEGAAALLRSPPPPVAQDPNFTNINGTVNTNNVLDRLACVQALLLYQAIRFFDGDFLLSSQAESDGPTLLAWADELVIVRDRMEDEMIGGLVMNGMNGQSIIHKAPRTWDDWILMESVRRTIIKAHCTVGLVECMRNRPLPAQVFSSTHSFTVSRHLWHAESSGEFFQAWHSKPQHRVFAMRFVDFFKHAKPEDIDDFGQIFLKMKLGVDETEAFMLSAPAGDDL